MILCDIKMETTWILVIIKNINQNVQLYTNPIDTLYMENIMYFYRNISK